MFVIAGLLPPPLREVRWTTEDIPALEWRALTGDSLEIPPQRFFCRPEIGKWYDRGLHSTHGPFVKWGGGRFRLGSPFLLFEVP